MLAGATADPQFTSVPAEGSRFGDARRLAVGFLVWAALAAAALIAARPPAPLATDAPADEASGARALETLRRLARAPGERVSPPRPVGSAANERCRERLMAECRRVGLFPEVVERFTVFADQNVAGTTRNVIARMRGSAAITEPGRAILCMAHYDSVGAGPGIGDDLAGVAALLEVARALRAGGGTERDVIFLFEDAEEHGLLGAEAFAAQHPWAKDVGVVINLEGRGTTGPSRMFETGGGNAWAIDAWSRVTDSPSATSVSVEAYRRMPNDTDYTVWRKRGVPGLNFAFIGDVSRYHTPLDDLAHLAPATLQHHVSNAFSAVRALDAAVFPVEVGDEVTTQGPDAVFFDIAGRTLVTLRVRTLRLLAGLGLLLALVGVGRSVASGGARGLRVVLGIPAVVLALLAAALSASLVWQSMLVLGAESVPFPAHPTPILIVLVAAALGGLTLACGGLGRWWRASEVGAALLLVHAFAALFLSWSIPGAAFLLVLPTLALAAASALIRQRGDVDARWGRAGIFALGLAAILWTPLHAGLVSAFGVGNPLVIVAPLLIVGSFMIPVLVRGWWPAAAGALAGALVGGAPWAAAFGLAVALLAAFFASTRPTHSLDRPGRVNLVHVQAGDEPARWQVMGLGSPLGSEVRETLEAALGLPGRETPAVPLPWSRWPLFAARAQRQDVEMPTLEIVAQRPTEDGDVRLEIMVRSPRGGDQLVLSVEGDCTLLVAGTVVRPHGFRFLGPGEDGQSFELILAKDAKLQIDLHDKRFGLDGPLARRARAFFAALPADFVPSHDGDGSLLIARHLLMAAGSGPFEVHATRVPRATTGPDTGDETDGDE